MKQSTSKNSQEQHTVEMLSRYPFGASHPNAPGRTLVKLTRRFTSFESDELKSKIEFHSKLRHPSLISIVRAFQSRQARFFDIFLEYVPKSISSTASQLNKQQLLQCKNNLKDLCTYLVGMNVYPEVAEELIGFESKGVVKLFLDVDFRVIKPTQNKGELIKIKFAEIGQVIGQYQRVLQQNPKQAQTKSQVCTPTLITSRSQEPFLRFQYVSPPKIRPTDSSMTPAFIPRGQTESRIYFSERRSHPLQRTDPQINISPPHHRHVILQSVSPPARSISLVSSFNSPMHNQQHTFPVLHKGPQSHCISSTMSRLTFQNPSNSIVYRTHDQSRKSANYPTLQPTTIRTINRFPLATETFAINHSTSNNHKQNNQQATKLVYEKRQAPPQLRVPIVQKPLEEAASESTPSVPVRSREKANPLHIAQSNLGLKMQTRNNLTSREQMKHPFQQLPTTVKHRPFDSPTGKITAAQVKSESSRAEPACAPQSPRESRRNQSIKGMSENSQKQISGRRASPMSSRREGQQQTINVAHPPIVINIIAQKHKYENNAANKLMDLARSITEHSLDTYYAQLGEILQMPRINITELRQTTQSPTASAPKQKEKLHESVGMHATKPILGRRGQIVQEQYGEQSPRESHMNQNPFRRKQHKLDHAPEEVDYINSNQTREKQNHDDKMRRRLYQMAQNFKQGSQANLQVEQQASEHGIVLMQYRMKNAFTMQQHDDPLTQQFNNLFESQNQTREHHESSHVVAQQVHTKQEMTEENVQEDNNEPEYQREYEAEYSPDYEPDQEQLEHEEAIEARDEMAYQPHNNNAQDQNNQHNVQVQHRSQSSSRPTEQRSRFMKESNSTSQADFVPQTNSRAVRSDQINQRVMMALKKSEAMLDYFNKFKMRRMEEQGDA